MPKTRISSAIPGQAINPHERKFNIQLLLIASIALTLPFLVSIQWSGFVNSSIETVQKKTNSRLPDPIAHLISAILVSAVSFTLLALVYRWERKVVRDDDDDEEEEA